MPSKQPRPEELEPIERASRDEMQAIQLERLRWSLGHAYRNVPHYKRAFDRAGARPEDLRSLADLPGAGIVSLCVETAPCGKFAAQVLAAAGVTIPEGSVTRGADVKATLAARQNQLSAGSEA